MRLTQRAAVEDGVVAWDVYGAGSPVVLVHGFPARAYIWRHVIPGLIGAGHRVFVYDQLGFGSSERCEGQELYFDGQARVLHALLRSWELDAPTVVAHDMGAGVAVVAATQCPGRIGRLVLASAAICPPAVTAGTLHMQRHLPAYATMPAATWAPLIRSKIATATHLPMDPIVLAAYAEPWLGDEGQAAYLRFVSQIDESLVEQTFSSLRHLDLPVTIIWGEEDTWLPVEQAELIASQLPKPAEVLTVPAAGHFLPEDAPGAVARLLRRLC